jgi:four helix bundle protein
MQDLPTVIKSYRDLRVWQLSVDLAVDVYGVSKNFPKAEVFGMTSQMRRSAVSIPANIAEGYGREVAGSFAQFLRIAQGSLKELETHVIIALRIDLINQTDANRLLGAATDIGKMLGSLIRKVAP